MSLLQVDMESFTDMSVFLKQASDHILTIAQELQAISDSDTNPQTAEKWKRIITEMMALNGKITLIENVLRAMLDEYRSDTKEKLPN